MWCRSTNPAQRLFKEYWETGAESLHVRYAWRPYFCHAWICMERKITGQVLCLSRMTLKHYLWLELFHSCRRIRYCFCFEWMSVGIQFYRRTFLKYMKFTQLTENGYDLLGCVSPRWATEVKTYHTIPRMVLRGHFGPVSVGAWFGVAPLSCIQETIHVICADFSIQHFTMELPWWRHLFYSRYDVEMIRNRTNKDQWR